jgi:hypothetical protein
MSRTSILEADEMTEYSNPRMFATVGDWPSGARRVSAHFEIEIVPHRGERGVRTTTGAPKKLTYARKARIVDGNDRRIYIAELRDSHVSIMRGDFKYQYETVFPDCPRYPEILALFDDPRRTP